MTPMIDVIFQLIIFFMVGSSFARMEKKLGLDVPTVSNQAALSDAPAKKIVNVYRDGKVTLDSQSVTLNELTKRLADARSQYRDLGVVVRGDGAIELQRTVEVLQAVKQSGVAEMAIAVRVAPTKR